jgi:hypothetical protein
VEPNGGAWSAPSIFPIPTLPLGTHIYAYVPPNDTTLSRLLGGKDPKTIRTYIWPYIASLAELENFVVSWLLSSLLFFSINFHSHSVVLHNRLILKTGRGETF